VSQTQTASRRRVGVRIVLVIVVLGIAAMWVYVLFIGKAQSPNKLADETWAQRAEAVCAATAAQVAALPPARAFRDVTPKSEALRQRAVVGQQATDLLRTQLDQLRALPAPAGRYDERLLEAWFADWESYLGDRQAHIADWRAGEDQPFAEGVAAGGGPITDRMDSLAQVNGMPSCEVPLDFG
jgi:hypothetical protein